jgi:glycosyltransferase involved in cell wall biosynthesis
MKKILLVSSSGFSKKEGISTFIMDEIQNIPEKSRFEFHLIVSGISSNEIISQFRSIGAKIHFVPSRKKNIFLYIISLIKIMWNIKFDVIHVNGSSTMLGIELLIAKLMRIRVRVAHSHNSQTEHAIMNILCRPIFNCSYNKAIACGNNAGKWLFGRKKYRVIKNGRDLKKYEYSADIRADIRKFYGIKSDEILIGHVGAFNKQKNQQLLIDILKQVREVQSARLILIGTGPQMELIKSKVRRENLEAYVIFTGEVNNVEEIMQGVDVMVLPSLFEGLPLVVVEWQIAGIPNIVSENVDHECKFTDLVSFLSLDSDVSIWANSVLKCYESFSLNERLNYPILAKDSGFDIAQTVDQVVAIYKG